MELKLNPKKMAWVLSAAMIALVILHVIACLPMFLGGRSYPWGYLSLDGEHNLPTMFSTALLWSSALLTGCIAWAEKNGRSNGVYWVGLAFAFIAMGLDESTMIHERFTEIVRALFETSGLLHYPWVIPYAIVILLFMPFYARFFFRLPSRIRKQIVLAMALYVSGAIGLEMVGGAWVEPHGKDAVFYLLVTTEEVLEMSGSIAFIYAFSSYIDRHIPGFCLRITSE